jgi:hypothetical protein
MKQRKRLDGDELAALAAKIGMSEQYLRALNSTPDELYTIWEDDWLEFLELDLQHERRPFDDACSEHDLLNRLNSRERKLLFRVWNQANVLKFLFDTPKKTAEDALTREEYFFVHMRNKLFRSKGWKRLPKAVAKDVECRLFTVEANL